jgi:hypothetical protein
VSQRPYVTAARLAAIQAQLRPIDRALLSDVARLNVMSGQHLRQLHYPPTGYGRRKAQLDLKRLADLRVLDRLERTIGGRRAGSDGLCFALGVAGQRIVHPDRDRHREPWTPDTNHLRHALAVSQLYVDLRRVEIESCTKIEHFDAEPRCWRFYHGAGGARLVLKPDAYVVTGAPDYIDSCFVELDRSTESTPRIIEKAKNYIRYWQSGREQARLGVFPTVLFVVPDERRRSQLVGGLARLAAEHWGLFQVVIAEDAAWAMTSGELIINENTTKEVTS